MRFSTAQGGLARRQCTGNPMAIPQGEVKLSVMEKLTYAIWSKAIA
jgi:hypothetical protein